MRSTAIVIVSYAAPELLRECLIRAIQHGSAVVNRFFVIDNLSEQSGDVRALVDEFPGVDFVFNDANVGFASAVNLAAESLECDMILLNPDAMLVADLDDFVKFARAEAGASCVGALCRDDSNERAATWDVAKRLPSVTRLLLSGSGYANRLRGRRASDLYGAVPTEGIGYIEGSFLFIPWHSWQRVGEFDSRFFLYGEELDWQVRARSKGLVPRLYPRAVYQHTARGTVSEDEKKLQKSGFLLQQSQRLYLRKHHGATSEWIFWFGCIALALVQRSKHLSLGSLGWWRDAPETRPFGRVLYVASTGGHLTQLSMLAKRFSRQIEDEQWVTFDNAQSRAVLAGRNVWYVGYVEPRNVLSLVRASPSIVRALRKSRADCVVSTGAGVALPAILAAVLSRKRAIYIESVSRVSGPSLTGRILSVLPGVLLFTQHEGWAKGRWRTGISLATSLNEVRPSRQVRTEMAVPLDRALRVFVTLGTIFPYRFDSLVDAIAEIAGQNDLELVWQLGATERSDLPGIVFTEVSSEDFDEYCRWADVVVTHSGVGTCLKMVEMGIKPILVPRRKHRGEHVDDHQLQIAGKLASQGLAFCVDPPQLDSSALMLAANSKDSAAAG